MERIESLINHILERDTRDIVTMKEYLPLLRIVSDLIETMKELKEHINEVEFKDGR